eukprot:gene21793-28203_t
MDSELDYTVAKSIVQSGQSDDDWESLRLGKGIWPVEKESWRQFRAYSFQELKDEMKAYKRAKGGLTVTPPPVIPGGDFKNAVTFDKMASINNLPVYHWNKCVKKLVNLPQLDASRFILFKASLRIAFDNEIGGATFRVYTLPHDFNDLEQRKEILSDEDFRAVLDSFLDLENIPPMVLVWNNQTDSTSPEALPAFTKNSENDTVGTRDTQTAEACKYRDNNSCLFCGFKRSGSFALESCHLFEYHTWRNIKKPDRQTELQKVGLVYIHEIPNLITLCLRCHNYFDKPHYMLGIHPLQYTLVVGKAIRDFEPPNNSLYPTYSALHGKKIVFNGEGIHQTP